MEKKVKFDVVLPHVDFGVTKQFALRAEELGFYAISLDDHFFMRGFGTEVTTPRLECFTTLTALATLTSKIRIAQVVAANSYRNPALLAKMTATLDVISGGRVELGIGAGWYREEYLAYGYDYPDVSIRIDQLHEGIQVIKKMWTHPEPTFTGKHYRIEKAYCYPQPVQKPRPPIMVGGSGKKVLRIAAEEADIVNLIPPIGKMGEVNIQNALAFTMDEFARRRDILAGYCRELGRRFEDIVLSGSCYVLMGESEKEVTAIAQMTAQTMGVADITAAYRSPNVLIGTPEHCVEELQRRVRNLGVTYFCCTFLTLEAMETFAKRVMPAF